LKEEKTVPLETYIKDIVTSHGMRARYLACIYDELVKRYGKETTFDILSKAIFNYGIDRAKFKIKQNPSMKSGNLEEFKWAPFLRYMHKLEVVEESPDRIEYRLHSCPLVDAWKDMGKTAEEIRVLCDIAMAMDDGQNVIFNELGVDTEWPKRIGWGDPYCVYIAKKVKK